MHERDAVPVNSNNGSGHLYHIHDGLFEDAVTDDVVADTTGEFPHDADKDDVLYFACMTNHYLLLVKASMSIQVMSCHDIKCHIIPDSGAN
jgi:hypothetical protein